MSTKSKSPRYELPIRLTVKLNRAYEGEFKERMRMVAVLASNFPGDYNSLDLKGLLGENFNSYLDVLTQDGILLAGEKDLPIGQRSLALNSDYALKGTGQRWASLAPAAEQRIKKLVDGRQSRPVELDSDAMVPPVITKEPSGAKFKFSLPQNVILTINRTSDAQARTQMRMLSGLAHHAPGFHQLEELTQFMDAEALHQNLVALVETGILFGLGDVKQFGYLLRIAMPEVSDLTNNLVSTQNVTAPVEYESAFSALVGGQKSMVPKPKQSVVFKYQLHKDFTDTINRTPGLATREQMRLLAVLAYQAPGFYQLSELTQFMDWGMLKQNLANLVADGVLSNSITVKKGYYQLKIVNSYGTSRTEKLVRDYNVSLPLRYEPALSALIQAHTIPVDLELQSTPVTEDEPWPQPMSRLSFMIEGEPQVDEDWEDILLSAPKPVSVPQKAALWDPFPSDVLVAEAPDQAPDQAPWAPYADNVLMAINTQLPQPAYVPPVKHNHFGYMVVGEWYGPLNFGETKTMATFPTLVLAEAAARAYAFVTEKAHFVVEVVSVFAAKAQAA